MHAATRVCLVFALTLSACSVEGDDPCIGMRKIATNKIATNKLATNKLATNKIATNGLLDNALSSDALVGDGAPVEDLRDPEMRDIFAYTVQCALPEHESVELSIDGELVTFEGALGLAPEWGLEGGSCDESCQHWVSACLISRVNAKGESVVISLRGDHPGLLPSADELAEFDAVEATYFGNVFGDAKQLHACLPDGATAIPRVCDDPSSCLVQIEGACSDVCDGSSCRAADGTVFAETITVQRDAAACGG